MSVSRSTMKRRLRELGMKWPSSKKRKQKIAAKKKLNSETQFKSNSSQQLVNSSTTNNDNIREYEVEADQLPLTNYLPEKYDSVDNSTLDPPSEYVQEILVAPQCHKGGRQPFEQQLEDPNERIFPNIAQKEGCSKSFFVNASYCDDKMRFEPPQQMVNSSEANQLQMPQHLLHGVDSLTLDPSPENVKEIDMAPQCRKDDDQPSELHLDSSNECTLPNIVQGDGSSNTFTVKATYNDDTVKFPFSLTHSMEQLTQEVGRRLKLEEGTFRIKYLDQDNDWIRMSSTSEFKDLLHRSRSAGLSYVRLSIIDERPLNGAQKRRRVLKENHEQLVYEMKVREKRVQEENHEQCTTKSEQEKFIQHSDGYNFPYSEQVTPCILPFIKQHTNIDADGHCGFRAIASFVHGDQNKWLNVRVELLAELIDRKDIYIRALGGGEEVFEKVCVRVNWLKPSAPPEHWFEALDMGMVVATKYQKVFIVWSIQGPLTFFPLEVRSNELSTGYIHMTLINSNHFVALHMSTTNIPLPEPFPLWNSNCHPDVKKRFVNHFKKQLGWYTMF